MDLARNLIQRINVGDSLTRSAAARPGQLAVVDGDRRWTYAEFNALANRVAHGLAGPASATAAVTRWPSRPATAPSSSPSTTGAPSSAWRACRSTWAGGRTR